MLEYVVRLLKFHGITDIAFLVNYKAEQIVNYFDDGSRFNVKISYVRDIAKLKGTAGSILNAYRQGVVSQGDTLFVYYGDILTTLDAGDLVKYHFKKRASATVALASGFSVRVGLADMDKRGRIHGFVEKPQLEKPVSIGIMVLKGDTLQDVEMLSKGKQRLDLMGNLIPHLIEEAKPVYGYLSKAFWYDVGSMEAYEKLNHRLIEKSLSYLFK